VVDQRRYRAAFLIGPSRSRTCLEKELRSVVEKREFVLAATPATLALKARAAIEPRYRCVARASCCGSGKRRR
jgi:hypothetical protein